MTATPPETGMGPEAPMATARSARRTRRLAIIGALALVLVAGAVLVGVTATGPRSGTLATQATKVSTSLYCFRSYNAEYAGDTSTPAVWLAWKFPAGTPSTTTYRAYQRTGTSPNFVYGGELASTVQSSAAKMADGSIAVGFESPDTTAQTFVITWGRTTPTGDDTYFSEAPCAAR